MTMGDEERDEDMLDRDEMRRGDEAPPGEASAEENVCPRCGGTGRIEDRTCPECEGTGRIEEAIGGG